MPSFNDVCDAAQRLRSRIHRTPIFTSLTLDCQSGRSLFFKCENLQKTGSFKFRGASNAVWKLDDATASRGVVTHSSGNHAQALALAAWQRGIPAHIVMPTTASPVKKAAVLEYGGRIIDCQPTLDDRLATAQRVQEQTGATMIPPFDHHDVIAGQATAMLELCDDLPDLDAVLAPVGGGGLLAGTCIAAQGFHSNIKVYAAEPLGADDAARSFSNGKWLPQTDPQTIADGLRTSLGTLTWPILQEQCHGVITVSEDEIIAATRLVWERMKIIIEPSAAVPVAAVLKEEFRSLSGLKRVGIILSGGNLDLTKLPW